MTDKDNQNDIIDVNVSEVPEEIGEIKVADEVVSIVAGLATMEIDGVAGMSGGIRGGISELLGKKNFSKGVHVEVDSAKNVTIELNVIVTYGYIIPDIALKIQENVKTSVKNMTGYNVNNIDVYVQGVRKDVKNNISSNEVSNNELEKVDF
jgi:uncharacterized alkaline shock family protein YloU